MTTRLRVRFMKHGKVRFTSHRDVARIWERAVRKAGLPVAYSEGFSPRARLSFGLALSTGYESDAEYLDIDLEADDLALGELPARLTAQLPVGMAVTAIAPISRSEPSLQQVVTSCGYEIELRPDPYAAADDPSHFLAALREAVAGVLAADELWIDRAHKGTTRRDDIRHGVLAVELHEPSASDAALVTAELSAQPRAVRPADLLVALVDRGVPDFVARVRRTHQWIQHDDHRSEPLAAVRGRDLGVVSGCASASGAADRPGPVPSVLVAAPPSALAAREEPNDVRTTSGFRSPEPLGRCLA